MPDTFEKEWLTVKTSEDEDQYDGIFYSSTESLMQLIVIEKQNKELAIEVEYVSSNICLLHFYAILIVNV